MKPTELSLLIPTFALLTAPALLGQDGKHDEEPLFNRAAVPVFAKATTGPRAHVENDNGQRLGVVRDHILDRQTGKILFIAVGPAQDEAATGHLVPYGRFAWSAEERRLRLPMTLEALEALPVYDPDNIPPLDEHGLASGGGDASPEGRPLTETLEAGARRVRTSLSTSVVRGSRILAMRDAFAEVTELVLEPKRGTIAFVLASTDNIEEHPYVIPWRALTWKVQDETIEGIITLPIGADELMEGPRLERGDTMYLENRSVLEGIYAFYKLPLPLALQEEAQRRG